MIRNTSDSAGGPNGVNVGCGEQPRLGKRHQSKDVPAGASTANAPQKTQVYYTQLNGIPMTVAPLTWSFVGVTMVFPLSHKVLIHCLEDKMVLVMFLI